MSASSPASDDALSLLTDLIADARRFGADQADTLLFDSSSVTVSRRKGALEALERSESDAIGLRVWVGARQASISSNDLSRETLRGLAERAVAMARVAPEDTLSTLADPALLAHALADLDLFDGDEPSVEHLTTQADAAEGTALSHAGITNSEGATVGYSAHRVSLATSGGFAGSYRVSSHSLSVSVLAGEGTGMERDYEYTSARHASDLESAEWVGRRAAERTLARLNPRRMPTCRVPVVFDPRVARGLLHSFTDAISGTSVAKRTSFLHEAMGEQVFHPSITIVDNPLLPRRLGSRPFDGEGVSAKERTMVENGVLKSWLLDTRSARQLGLTSTGHASRGVGSPPHPSPSNLHILPGTQSPAELMADIRHGFYVTETMGMGVNLVTGDYSQGASGFWIENGTIAHPVSEVTIAGTLREMFASLAAANDLEFRGKINSPTLRVEAMTVAGE